MTKLILIFCSLRLFAESFEVSIVSVFRDEAPFLKEWIEFHKLIGVEHFYLYNNNSSDDFQEVLQPYIKARLVELIDWSREPQSKPHWELIQQEAFLDAVLKTKSVSKWVAFIDVDEFIFPVKDKTLPQFLKKYETFGAVAMNWQLFGTSKIKKLKKNLLMIEQLIRRAKDDYSKHWFVKSIVQVKFVDTTVSPALYPSSHTLPLIEGALTVNSHEEPLDNFAMKGPSIVLDDIRLHHYAFRDENFFQNVKLTRPNTDFQRKQCLKIDELNANAIEDKSILIYADELKQAMINGLK